MRRVETLLACMFLCCMIVCGEDVELKQDLGVKNQGEIATAKATVPGKMTSAEVKNYDGWNGWKGGIASENSAEFNATVPAGFSGVHKPSFGGWFANSNGGNGGSGNGGLKSWKLDATVRSYDIAIDSVEHADYIGDLADGQKVYCTSQKANDYVTIKLRTIPQNATLPEGVVKWEGGEQGENQLIRKVSKRNLIEGGLPINAKINGSDASIKIRVYVYRAKPNTKVDVTINKFRDDMACRSEARIKGRPIFGVAFIESCTDGISSNNVVFSYYYKDEEKKFIPIFKSLSYEIQWGVFDNGRTNINDGKERDPFPLGRGMVASISNKERRIIARNDFMEQNGIKRNYYWCRTISEKHENFHINDWTAYAKSAAGEIAKSLENHYSARVTTRQLEPQRVVGYFLDRERTDRIVKKPLLEKYQSSYQPGYREDGSRIPGGAEERAFNYCIPMYSQLVDNINRNINE